MANKQASLLPSPFETLQQAWGIYVQRIGTFLGIMLIPVLVMALIFVLSAGLYVTNFSGGAGTAAFGVGIVGAVALIIAQIWAQVALLYAIKDTRENIGMAEAYRRAKDLILSYIWVSLLVGLVTLAGFLLLIIPGIIFMVWYLFAVYILVSEDKKGMAALRQSREYVRGKWADVFVQVLFLVVIIFVASIIITQIFGEQFGNLLTNLFIVPFGFTYYFVLYSFLKSGKNELAAATPQKPAGNSQPAEPQTPEGEPDPKQPARNTSKNNNQIQSIKKY